MDLDFDDQHSTQVTTTKAGARFKPKVKRRPSKKHSTSQHSLNESTSSSPFFNNNQTLNESNFETFSQEIVWGMEPEPVPETVPEPVLEPEPEPEPHVLRACTNVESSEKQCDDLEVPETQESAMFNDFVSSETVGEECHLDMETLDIVQESNTAYEQHTGKFQPKPRLIETVIEEHNDIVNDEHNTGYFAMEATESEFMINEESRNDFNINSDFYEDFGDELNIPQVPGETVLEMETEQVSGEWEHDKHDDSTSNDTITRAEKKAVKSKGAAGSRKRKKNNEEVTKSGEEPEKKFKHSTRRQRRTLEKELLETPDDEIRYLPFRDMLRLVDYKEWLEKKEAKGAAAATQAQEQPQGDIEDDFGLESGENQEIIRAKPDSPVNYHSHMNRTARSRWSKQDTELFYEGIREFGSNLSMVQQLFSDRSREQIKLKFKLEERRHPLKLNDALLSRSKHHIHFQNVIKKLKEEAAAAGEGEEGDEEEEEGATAGENLEEAEVTDVPENEVPEKSEETERTEVKSDGGEGNGVRLDGGDEYDDEGDDDADYWGTYQSDI